MVLREIHTWPSAVLKERAVPVDDFGESLQELVDDMVETMYAANAQYRAQVEAANTLVQEQQKELVALQLKTGTDFLTGVANRSGYDDRIKEMINISRRYGNVFSLVVIDIDLFKAVNDTHGHIAGDVVLRDTAKILQSFSRHLNPPKSLETALRTCLMLPLWERICKKFSKKKRKEKRTGLMVKRMDCSRNGMRRGI